MCSGLGKFFIPWGLFCGCHVAARPCPRVSVETPPPHVNFKVPFSSAVHPQEGGGRKRNDEGSTQRPKPECRDPSKKEKIGRKDGAPQKGGRRAPEVRGGKKGVENPHPHQEMVVVRVKKGPLSADLEIVGNWEDSDAVPQHVQVAPAKRSSALGTNAVPSKTASVTIQSLLVLRRYSTMF